METKLWLKIFAFKIIMIFNPKKMKFIFVLELDAWNKLCYTEINLWSALNLKVSFTEVYLKHNKLYQQRNKFALFFIFEIDSSILWWKTIDYGWIGKAFATRNSNWFVFWQTVNCVIDRGSCWCFDKRFCDPNVWFHFPNAFNLFKISPVALLIFVQWDFFYIKIVKKLFVPHFLICPCQTQTL